jgi:hypothetical protein
VGRRCSSRSSVVQGRGLHVVPRYRQVSVVSTAESIHRAALLLALTQAVMACSQSARQKESLLRHDQHSTMQGLIGRYSEYRWLTWQAVSSHQEGQGRAGSWTFLSRLLAAATAAALLLLRVQCLHTLRQS